MAAGGICSNSDFYPSWTALTVYNLDAPGEGAQAVLAVAVAFYTNAGGRVGNTFLAMLESRALLSADLQRGATEATSWHSKLNTSAPAAR